MPNFDAKVFGSSVLPWPDPASATGEPSRLHPDAPYPQWLWVVHPGGSGVGFSIRCIVNGVEAPLDTALGGDLFTWSWVDQPLATAPTWSSPAGQSSIRNITIASGVAAHFSVLVRRSNGGGIIVPFDAWDV